MESPQMAATAEFLAHTATGKLNAVLLANSGGSSGGVFQILGWLLDYCETPQAPLPSR
jgi:hypothetical protein